MKKLSFPLKMTIYPEPNGPADVTIFETREALEREVARLSGGSAEDAAKLTDDLLRGDTVSIASGEAEWTLHADEDPTMQT